VDAPPPTPAAAATPPVPVGAPLAEPPPELAAAPAPTAPLPTVAEVIPPDPSSATLSEQLATNAAMPIKPIDGLDHDRSGRIEEAFIFLRQGLKSATGERPR
jgi:hypothetical protein